MVNSELCRNACVLLTAVVLACGLGGRAYGAEDWITVNKDYSGQRYVDLDQITPDNVASLKQVCELQFNEPSWFSSGLLMVGRTLYASTMRATYAVDATSCEPRWRHVIELGTPANVSSRGVGYLDGVIFRGTVDGRVIALDAGTGRVLWDVKHADPAKNKSFVSAPIAWDGKVFIGIAISDLGIRGRIMAIDAKTGNEIWRFYTVPANDESGPAKWGGGGFWSTFTLDPQRGEILAPVANPAPDYNTEVRPGDNLYTNSIIALDAASGKLNWFYQVTPHDDHDWDYGTAPTLYRTRSGRDMVAAAGKNGYVLGLDRATRAVVFNTPAEPVSNNGPITWDMPQRVCPGLGGGAQFTGAAYSPITGALYVGMVDWCSYYAKPRPKPPANPQEAGQNSQSVLDYDYEGAVAVDFGVDPKGWITAVDGETGQVLWKYQTDAQVLAGVVPTKGGVVFGGDVRGNLFAFDACNGTVLKHIDAGGALNSGLISYALDNRQYVAAAVGGVTLNTAGVAGPLKISIFGLSEEATPKIAKLDRLPPQAQGAAADAETFGRICAPCHGGRGQGRLFPNITAYTDLADPAHLQEFLATVPPPMPRLYPGLLDTDDVRRIAAYMAVITGATAPR